MASSPETSSAGFSSFSLRVFSKWDRSRLVGSLASSTSSGGENKEPCYCWRGEPTQELTQARERAWGAHTPRACRHAMPTAAAVTLGMPCASPLGQAPGGCQGCGCWGKRHGQLLGSEEGLAARGECKGCAWKGLPGLGCSTSTHGSCCPAGPWSFPRQLRGSASVQALCCCLSVCPLPQKLHGELETVPRLGLPPALRRQPSLAHPGCPTFASGAVPSQFSHLCLHIPLEPSAQHPVPRGSVPGVGSMRQLPPLGKAPHCPQNWRQRCPCHGDAGTAGTSKSFWIWETGLDFSRGFGTGLGTSGSSRAPLSPETVLSIS